MKTNEPVFDAASIAPRLQRMSKWTFADGWLKREYTTTGWRVTMLVVNAIAFLAEAADHHPDLEVHWGRVVVQLQTRSAGSITEKDVQLAERIEQQVMWQPEGTFPGLTGRSGDWIRD